jgi:general stress protein YciG
MSDKDKGFASMDKDKVKKIAAKGGHASHKGKDSDKQDNDSKSSKTKDANHDK